MDRWQKRQEDMDTTTQTSFIHSFIHLFKLNKFLSAWHEGPFILKCLDKKQCSSTFKCRQIIWKSPQKKAQCSESLYRSSLKVIKVFDGAVQISKRPLSYVNEEELWSTFQLSTNTDFVVSLRVQRGHWSPQLTVNTDLLQYWQLTQCFRRQKVKRRKSSSVYTEVMFFKLKHRVRFFI